ncbi:MAG: MgtC/SapB family protein [bacterium]|nr:MgtC/SapB family protein [bacterium]
MLESVLVIRLIAAALLGGLLGLERSIAGKHAGMRTYALVSLGSALFVGIGTIASFQLSIFSGINPLQIASNVVLGVGFIGAGLAVFRGEHPVELTTASGLWVVAGIGMACGFGLYILAIVTTVLGIVIFSVLAKLERRISSRFGTKHEE